MGGRFHLVLWCVSQLLREPHHDDAENGFSQYSGGDPAKVTLFGQSSGAISASYQMLAKDGDLSYKGQNLFRAAIMESGAVSHRLASATSLCSKS